jgi:ferrous iron transport protein A
MRAFNLPSEADDELSLARLPIGAQARVIAVNGNGPVARRLMEMGVVPGAPVRVIKAAPLGDPIEVRVRGYNLALRRTEAQTILVTSDE